MILKKTLDFLINQKKCDAKVLYDGRRYAAAIYLYGYAIEIALKKRICMTLGFSAGFPETQAELNSYIQQVTISQVATAGVQITFRKVQEIRNHQLSTLLYYSGKEVSINQRFLSEWKIVSNWNPEHRYLRKQTRQKSADEFFRAANLIIKEIM